MKLQPEINPALNTVTAYGEGFVEINARRFEVALIVRPEGEVIAWEARQFELLAPEHFELIAAHAPDLVVLGTGARQRFPDPSLTASLARAAIGVEVMDTRAACRTYNILMSEGRKVLAALLPP
ncbi:MAG: Mth938-like domain-containing protein [Burkholderiaceae bacterium]|nr:Mth938-like domain-containing protein [Burkholderiaceae bacterium]